MALTKKDKKQLLSCKIRRNNEWTEKEVEKLREAKKMGASTLQIYRSKILPNRSYKSIECKFFRGLL